MDKPIDRTHQVMELANGDSYIVIKQFNEEDGVFYFTGKVTEDGEDLTGDYVFFKQVEKDGSTFMEEFTDEDRIKNFKFEEDDKE